MNERGAGSRPDILENVDVLETNVLVEVDDALAVTGEDFRDSTGAEFLQGDISAWRFDDHFVGANATQAVVQADWCGLESAFNAHCRIAVRHDADGPARLVGLRLIFAHRVDLGRGEAFVALGEWVERGRGELRGQKVLRPPLPLRGKDDPDIMQRVAAKFRRHTSRQ
jgi:hypothetical protein